MENSLGFSGKLTMKKISAPKAPLAWRIRHLTNLAFVLGWLQNFIARAFSQLFGIVTISTQLSAVLIKQDGSKVNYGALSFRAVTDLGVAFLVDDWDTGATSITNMNYHASGTGNTTPEGATNTVLDTEVETRQAGTKSQPTAPQLRSIATIGYTATRTIVEHGIFSANSSGTLWDRHVFTGIGVGNGDSIQFTYTCTVNSGG